MLPIDLVSFVAGSTNIWDIRELPQGLNNVLFGGTNLLGAQVMLTVFVTVLILLPTIMAKANSDVIVSMIILSVLLNTALGWLDVFLGTIMCILIAAVYAGIFRKMVAG
jgi:hypothetical protein